MAMAFMALEWLSLRTEHLASINVRDRFCVTSDLESALLQLRGNQRFISIRYRGAFLTGGCPPANLARPRSRVIVNRPASSYSGSIMQ